RVHVERERGRGAPLGDLAKGVGVGDRIGAETAVVLRDRQGEQAGLAQLRVILVGKRGLGVVFRRARREALTGERRRALDERALPVGERGQREHWATSTARANRATYTARDASQRINSARQRRSHL